MDSTTSPCDRINGMIAEAKGMRDDNYYLWLLCATAAMQLDKKHLAALISGCATELANRT